MAAKVLLYNLAEHITDEEFKKYVVNEKGPLIESMSSVKKYELFKITGSAKGKVPYKYVGIVHVTSIDDFEKNDAPSQTRGLFD